jgi:Coenzyme PQQ synthesis protein D (PqqD)
MSKGAPHYRVNDREISAKVVDGEAVIINLSTGVYYSLTGSGALVWALLERGHGRGAIVDELSRRYGIDAERAGADLDELLATLGAEALIAETDSRADPSPSELDFPAGGYEPPTLEKYADMADLLALDPPMPGLRDIPWRESAG